MSVFDINKICRVCLEEGALVSIYSTEDAISPFDMIVSCTNIKITDNDELPSSICEYCIRRLGVAFQFKQQCENSDMRLRECLGLDGPSLLVNEEKLVDDDDDDGEDVDDDVNNIEDTSENIELQKCQKTMERMSDNINTIGIIVNPINPIICNNLDDFTPAKFCNVGVSFGEVGTQVKDEEILAAMNAVCEMFDTNEHSDVLLLTTTGNNCEPTRKVTNNINMPNISNITSTISTNTAAATVTMVSHEPSNLDPLINNPYLNRNNDEQLSLINTNTLNNIVCSNNNRHNGFNHLNDVNNGGFQAVDLQTLELPEQLLKLPLTDKNIDFKEQSESIQSLNINEIDQNLISTTYENNFYNKITINLATEEDNRHINTDIVTTTPAINTEINKPTNNNKYQSNSKKKTKNLLTKPETCLDCGKTFSKSGYLDAHMRTHTGDRPYKCKICHLQFAQTGNLALHMRVHTGEKPYQCELCSKLFSTSSNLKAHQRIHSEERNYKCKQCERAFKSMAELTSHVGTHTGVKNHSCELCGKAFYKTSYLNLHFRNVHVGEKRHRCTECGKVFSNSSNLTCHFRIHTGEKPFKCQYCDARFNQSSAMVRHLRQHKPDEVTNKMITETANVDEHMNYSLLNKFTPNS